MVDWIERAHRARARYEDGGARLPEEPDERQRQLTRMGNAAWAAGLAYSMVGDPGQSREWLLRAAETYRRSWPDAPHGSWGRPIGAMKSRLIAGDLVGAEADARWALDAGAAQSASPIGRYAAALACLVLGADDEAREAARTLDGHEHVPAPVTESLLALSSADSERYEGAIRALLADFEGRAEFLEDLPVADTVLALQALARSRGVELELESALLPE